MNKEQIILMTTLKNARGLLNSVACEASLVGDGMHESIGKIISKLADLERQLEKSHEDK